MTFFTRSPERLQEKVFDVLVIGGGINGLGIAWDAARRGMSVALIEKNDFGSGTSAGCFKIVHGGLRYLQHLDLARLFKSVREQRTLRIIAPHLIHPFPFLVPCYGHGMKGKGVLKLGLFLYELLAFRRNQGVSKLHELPAHRVLKKHEVLRDAPGVSEEGLTGGVVFYDCQMSNCDRLTLAVAQSAARAGAVLVNYVEAETATLLPNEHSQKILSITATDKESGRQLTLKAHQVVNATGPWNKELVRKLLGASESACEPEVFSKGLQVILPRGLTSVAVAAESRHVDPASKVGRGGRSYFLVPWRGATLVGTSDSIFRGSPDRFVISKEEVEEFLTEVQSAYRAEELCKEQVTLAFGGLRPVAPEILASKKLSEKEIAKTSREDEIIDHSIGGKGIDDSGVENLLTVVGVKYTTFRALAEKTVDILEKKLKKKHTSCRTKTEKLFGGEIEDYPAFLTRQAERRGSEIPHKILHSLITNYGSEVISLYNIINEDPELVEPLSKDGDVIGAECVYAAREQMVCKLSDVVFRRTGLGTLGNPGRDALAKAAELVGAELGWGGERQRVEVEEVEAMFLLG